MKIENNILKHHLKNVYWIGGTACGGKTTVAKALAEKHHLTHYNADEMFNGYREIASNEHQPYLSMVFKDADAYFNRPIDEYLHYLNAINRESFEMMLVDLMKLSEHQQVLVEGHYPPDLIKEVTDLNRVVFCYAEENIIRRDYFDREDKQSMLTDIKGANNNTELVDYVIDVVISGSKDHIKAGLECGYNCIERRADTTIEERIEMIEKHFNL